MGELSVRSIQSESLGSTINSSKICLNAFDFMPVRLAQIERASESGIFHNTHKLLHRRTIAGTLKGSWAQRHTLIFLWVLTNPNNRSKFLNPSLFINRNSQSSRITKVFTSPCHSSGAGISYNMV